MVKCKMCDKFFRSNKALKQHETKKFDDGLKEIEDALGLAINTAMGRKINKVN